MRQRLDLFDGCPNQFAYCDNFYQIAVWRAKTARWAKHRLADTADAAAATAATGEMLKAGMVVAFTADKNDKGQWPLEGNYYLALLKGPAYPVPESQVQATDRFEAGWLVADVQGQSPRSYKLAPETRTLVVSEMIRLSTIRWDKVDKRSPRLGQTLYYLGEDTHNMIEGCVRDQNA